MLSDRYLFLIAMLMLIYNLVNTNGEYILGKTVIGLYTAHHGAAAGGLDEKKVIGEFYGSFFTWVNIIAAGDPGVRGLAGHQGLWRPAARCSCFRSWRCAVTASMAIVPLLSLIRGVKLAENSLDYSLQNTSRNALYLPTSTEAKYKAKQANDTFFVRFGDVASAGVVLVGTTLGFAPRQFALVNVVLVAIWLILAVVIGRSFQRLARHRAVG